jgi:hypothetical protein
VRRLALLLALLAAASGAGAMAGCGGTDEEADRYVGRVNRAQESFADRFAEIQGRMSTTSTPREDRRALRDFRAATDTIVAQLRAIRPPEEVADLHGELVRAVAGYGREIDRARALLDEGDPKKVIRARTQLSGAVGRVSRRITAVIAAINDRLQS